MAQVQETKSRRVWYMYYWRDKKRMRSPEYNSLTEFVAACGKWCDAHPDDYQLLSRTVREVAE